MLIILVAAVLKIGHPAGFIVLPFYIWYMNRFQIRPEEAAMEEKFGEEYLKYKRRVRRWI
jgi:protein-S-isoprenylcysteine O-methyltransferase Ste14